MNKEKSIKTVILCGGMGTRLREETEYRPKPLVEIGGKPILWHIMKIYSHYGYKDFILCLGYKGEMIKEYFLNYEMLNSDFTIELGSKNIEIHNSHEEYGLKISLVDTGEATMTGARVKKVGKFIDSEIFMLTYGDGVADINISKLLEFHKSHGKIGTITGVHPVSRFGELVVKDNKVKSFAEKPQSIDGLINGGFFVFNKEFLDYIHENDDCVLEKDPMEKLVKDGELMVYKHDGFWQCMDTYRDFTMLNNLWKTNPQWKIW